ncbi:hypothetical protein LINPERHAP2_LOCUS11975 [Linum perenne]
MVKGRRILSLGSRSINRNLWLVLASVLLDTLTRRSWQSWPSFSFRNQMPFGFKFFKRSISRRWRGAFARLNLLVGKASLELGR